MKKAKSTRKAQVHRYGDSVAVWIGNGACTYISPNDARALAAALTGAANDVDRNRSPINSSFLSRNFDFSPTEESAWKS